MCLMPKLLQSFGGARVACCTCVSNKARDADADGGGDDDEVIDDLYRTIAIFAWRRPETGNT